MLCPTRWPSWKPVVSRMSSELKSWTTASRVLVTIKNTIVSDMLSFCRFCRVSFCTFESIWAPLESISHRHALFERHGTTGGECITEPIEYHRHDCRNKSNQTQRLNCCRGERKKGILRGRTLRESGSPDASASVLSRFDQFNFKIRVHRECRRHRRQHLRCRQVRRCRGRIDRSSSYRRSARTSRVGRRCRRRYRSRPRFRRCHGRSGKYRCHR